MSVLDEAGERRRDVRHVSERGAGGKPGDDAVGVGTSSPIPAQLFHFATLFPFALSFGTTLERIAAESLTPR
jgi:hypothetical protein